MDFPKAPVRLPKLDKSDSCGTDILADWMGRILNPPIPSLIAIRDHTMHARRRRPWNRAFNTSALKEYEHIIAKRVSQLVGALEEQKGVVDLTLWLGYFT